MSKELHTKIIALSSELTCLHGRYELSPRGVALLRDMAHEARLALDPDKEMETKAVGRKPPAPNPDAEPLWRGYRLSDIQALAKRGGDFHPGGGYYVSADGELRFMTVEGDFRSGANDREERLRNNYGLRRPDEPDYKRLA